MAVGDARTQFWDLYHHLAALSFTPPTGEEKTCNFYKDKSFRYVDMLMWLKVEAGCRGLGPVPTRWRVY